MGITTTLKNTGSHFRTTLVAGLLVIIPVVVTFLILKFIFDVFEPLLKPFFEDAADFYTPGMGIVALVIILYLAGLITTHVIGRRLINAGHRIVDFIPIVRSVYRTARQATVVFSTVNSNGKFTSVVMVDFPGNGLQSLGLVTARLKDRDGKPLLAVYMPTSPFPTSGFLVIVPEDRVTPTDMPVDDAMKLIVSAGLVAPERITTYPNPLLFPPGTCGSPSSSEGAPYVDDLADQPHVSGNRASNQ